MMGMIWIYEIFLIEAPSSVIENMETNCCVTAISSFPSIVIQTKNAPMQRRPNKTIANPIQLSLMQLRTWVGFCQFIVNTLNTSNLKVQRLEYVLLFQFKTYQMSFSYSPSSNKSATTSCLENRIQWELDISVEQRLKYTSVTSFKWWFLGPWGPLGTPSFVRPHGRTKNLNHL